MKVTVAAGRKIIHTVRGVVYIICDRAWEKGTFHAKIEFLISGTRGSAKRAL